MALAAAGRAESAAAAEKLAVAGRIWRAQHDADAASGVVLAHRAAFVAAEIATTLSVSRGAAAGLMNLGDVLETRLPGVRRALEQGFLDVARVRVIADRTASISDLTVLAEVERDVLGRALVPGRCVTRGQAQRIVDEVVARVDPASVVERSRRAHADRQVQLRPDLDGMCSLWGVLPAADGVALDQRLRRDALALCGEDPRTLDQRRADVLSSWAHGRGDLECECGSPVCPTAADGPRASTTVVQVVVDAATLLGAQDLPGVLAGFGIVDPAMVRTLAADARWQRILTLDGVPVQVGTSSPAGAAAAPAEAVRYRPSAALARLVRTRDGHCRFPGCTVTATSCDLDHVQPFDHGDPRGGGRTVAANLACLCRWHHRMKTADEWQVRMSDGAVQHWTGPHGQELHSVPRGLPPSGSGPPGAAPPVLAPQRRDDEPLQAPPAPAPDGDPPQRWTPDGHWAADPWSDNDVDDALRALLRERRVLTTVGTAHTASTSCDPETPPF